MASNVTIYTYDEDDSSLIVTKTIKATSYTVSGKRNVLSFPLKLLKVMNDIWKASEGDYDKPPVMLIDTGSTVKRFTIKGYIAASPVSTDPVADNEETAEALMDFFDRICWMADRCLLQIGESVTKLEITHDRSSLAWTNDSVEGKVDDYTISWDEKTPKILNLTIEFIVGYEVDWF